jgi:hypothetical protein
LRFLRGQRNRCWYQAFPQDIVDDGTYGRLTMPVLGLAGVPGYDA